MTAYQDKVYHHNEILLLQCMEILTESKKDKRAIRRDIRKHKKALAKLAR